MNKRRAITLCSGGLDSVTLAWYLRACGFEQHLVAADYGQRNRRELAVVEELATELGVRLSVLPLPLSVLRSSMLTNGETPLAVGVMDDAAHRGVYVPNRNVLFLAYAYAIAIDEGASCVALGAEGDTANVSPDNFPETLARYAEMQRLATQGFARPELFLYTPFVQFTKAQVAALAVALGVPVARTWSCYDGGLVHCGVCRACRARRQAFRDAGLRDETPYQKEDV